MATTAQRQAAYRSRRNEGEGDRRLNTWINTAAATALTRLAARYGVTKRQMLERLILEQDETVLATLELDTPEWEAYFEGVTQ